MNVADSPDADEIAAMQRRRTRLRIGAAEIVSRADRGETVDPHSLEWAKQVVRNNRPAAGWLGEEKEPK